MTEAFIPRREFTAREIGRLFQVPYWNIDPAERRPRWRDEPGWRLHAYWWLWRNEPGWRLLLAILRRLRRR